MPNSSPVAEDEQNPIVALASRIRARRNIAQVLGGADIPSPADIMDAASRLAAFAAGLQEGAKRLNSILGRADGVKFIRLEKPLRIRLRFREKRVTLDLDEGRQLVLVAGGGLDGEYQFAETAVPSLINLSRLSTAEGYREPMTPSALLQAVAQEAELPRPGHLDEGPLRF
jgi:hypothetical protein